MTTHIFHSERRFELSDYSPSHCRLLIRSVRAHEGERNIDVIFFGVSYIEIGSYLRGLTIRGPTEPDFARVSRAWGEIWRDDRVFVLESSGRQHLVVAAVVKVYENDLDPLVSSLTRVA